jgi:hypothetical protein
MDSLNTCKDASEQLFGYNHKPRKLFKVQNTSLYLLIPKYMLTHGYIPPLENRKFPCSPKGSLSNIR